MVAPRVSSKARVGVLKNAHEVEICATTRHAAKEITVTAATRRRRAMRGSEVARLLR